MTRKCRMECSLIESVEGFGKVILMHQTISHEGKEVNNYIERPRPETKHCTPYLTLAHDLYLRESTHPNLCYPKRYSSIFHCQARRTILMREYVLLVPTLRPSIPL